MKKILESLKAIGAIIMGLAVTIWFFGLYTWEGIKEHFFWMGVGLGILLLLEIYGWIAKKVRVDNE